MLLSNTHVFDMESMMKTTDKMWSMDRYGFSTVHDAINAEWAQSLSL